MPTSKSSTSSECPGCADLEARLKQCQDTAAETWSELVRRANADADVYKRRLDSLLAAVHRDGGQYTVLAGYETSVDEACCQVVELYRKNAALVARIGQHARGEVKP